jgi:hypothetical protein
MIRKTIAAVSLALLIVPFMGAAANASHTECNAIQLAKRLINGTAGECFYDTPPPP